MQLSIVLSYLVVLSYCYQVTVAQTGDDSNSYIQPYINTQRNNDYYGFMQNFVGFTCEATGTELEYFWKHKDQLITVNTPLKFPKLNSSTLKPIQQNIELPYEGPYQCFARNKIGTVFGRKANVKFTVVGKFYKESTSPIPVNVKLNIHQSIACPSHRYSHNVQYQWEYLFASSPHTLEPKDYFFVTSNGTLHFSLLTKAQVDYINSLGGIQCTQRATVDGDTKSRSSHRIKLFVTDSSIIPRPAKPRIIEISESRSVGSSESTVLACGAVGNPVPQLKWYRKGATSLTKTEVKPGGGFILGRFNQYLNIVDITKNKVGTYVCVATNSEGTDEKETQISVQDPPQWTVGGKLTDVQPPIDSEFIWTCMALGGATYIWYKDGIKLDETSKGKFEINNNRGYSSLVIKKMAREYNGMYECTAGNEKDTIYSIGRLHVKENKPIFLEQMGPITLIETKRGTVPCPVDAAPLPTIVWKKDKQKLDLSDKQKRYSLAANKRDLLLTNVTQDDKGVYTCRATNNLGETEGSSDITIGVDIYWVTKPSHNTNVTRGLKFEVDCEANGDPSYEVKYHWLRNGLPLEYSARVHWVQDQHRLLILDSLVTDTGTYTCTAFAQTPLYIHKSVEILVEVKDAPNPPDLVAVHSSGSCWKRDAKLVWTTASLNNEAELWNTIIEWSTTYEPANWTELAVKKEGAAGGVQEGTELKLDFSKLPPYSQISFRVILTNRLGYSEPSQPSLASECVTGPSAPPHPPKEIKGVAGGPNTLTLEWTHVRQMYWGGPDFKYVVQMRRKTKEKDDGRWSRAYQVFIDDGHNNSIPVYKPGYYNEWEFRVKCQNRNGSSGWTHGTAYSGQQAPSGTPSGLTTDRIAARSVDLSWGGVTPPRNGTVDGYLIRYWYSVVGVTVDMSNTRRKKRETDEEEEEELHCFDPKNPCTQESIEKESQLTNLEPYKTYHIRISAFNSGGKSPFSKEFKFQTEDDTPGPPYAMLVFGFGEFAKLTWKKPRHENGKILRYKVFGNNIVSTTLPWWSRRHIIYGLAPMETYEVQLIAETSTGWGEIGNVWFNTTRLQKPAKPLLPQVEGYGEDGVNVTFMEPLPIFLRKYGGEIYDDPWEHRPVGGYENEHHGRGGYPATFYVLYRKAESGGKFEKTESRRMWGEQEQTWIVIENLQRLTNYEFATVPVSNRNEEGPRSDLAIALPGGIVPKVKKLHWYQRDWFIALAVLFGAACILFLIVVLSTKHLKNIYYEGAPKRRKDREKEKIFEPEDVTGGFDEFTLKSARSSRSVVTSRSGPPPPYSMNGSMSRHSGEFDEDSVNSDDDDEKNEVDTYYSDDTKKIPLDELDEDDEEDTGLATFV